MAIAIVGTDGNPFTTRDIDGIGANFVTTRSQLVFSGSYATGGDKLDLTAISGLIPSGSVPVQMFCFPFGTAAVPSLAAAGGTSPDAELRADNAATAQAVKRAGRSVSTRLSESWQRG